MIDKEMSGIPMIGRSPVEKVQEPRPTSDWRLAAEQTVPRIERVRRAVFHAVDEAVRRGR